MIVPPFTDVEEVVVDYLFSRLPDFPSSWSETPVRAVSLPDWSPGDDPELTVHCEESAGEPPINQRATVRVTAWADDRGDAKELARLAHTGLLEHPGEADVVSVRQIEGVVVGDEGDLADHHASFTVLVTQRPA